MFYSLFITNLVPSYLYPSRPDWSWLLYWRWWPSVLIWMLVPWWRCGLFGCLSRCQNMVKKYRVRWRSRFAINFGWHYGIIQADLLSTWFEGPTQCHGSDLAVPWDFPGTVIELAGYWSVSINLPVSVPALDAEFLCLKFWPKL